MKTQRHLSYIRKGDVDVLELPGDDFDDILDVSKINGDEYEPDTISGFQRTQHSEIPFDVHLIFLCTRDLSESF